MITNNFSVQLVEPHKSSSFDSILRLCAESRGRFSSAIIAYANGSFSIEMRSPHLAVRAAVQAGGGPQWKAEVDANAAAYLIQARLRSLDYVPEEQKIVAVMEGGEKSTIQARCPDKTLTPRYTFRIPYGIGLLSRIGYAAKAVEDGYLYIGVTKISAFAFAEGKSGESVTINGDELSGVVRLWKVKASLSAAMVEFEHQPNGLAFVEDHGDMIAVGSDRFCLYVRCGVVRVGRSFKAASPCKYGQLTVRSFVDFLDGLSAHNHRVRFSVFDGRLCVETVTGPDVMMDLSGSYLGEPFASGSFGAREMMYVLRAIRSDRVKIGLCEDGLAVVGQDSWASIKERYDD